MANFDFISDDRFRAGLLADSAEMQAAATAGAWKAVHVLAGTIVEAVLIDYLSDTEREGRPKADPMKMDLAEAIDICLAEHVLSQKTAALSHVIRTYRNLIHPGRVIRLAERVDENSGRVAMALTEMVVEEVSRQRVETVGYTAEQLATKLQGDPSSTAILRHLIPRLNGRELEKFILHVLPAKYIENAAYLSPEEPPMVTLRTAYRAAMEGAPEPVRRRASAWYAGVVREEEQRAVHAYQEGCFRAAELPFYTSADRLLVVDHLLARMEKDRTMLLFEIADGIGPHLHSAHADVVVDIVIKEILYGSDTKLDERARSWIYDVYAAGKAASKARMKYRLTQWQALFPDDARRTAQIADLFELADLPF